MDDYTAYSLEGAPLRHEGMYDVDSFNSLLTQVCTSFLPREPDDIGNMWAVLSAGWRIGDAPHSVDIYAIVQRMGRESDLPKKIKVKLSVDSWDDR